MTSESRRLTFIGGGNMAQSLVAGLLARGWSATDIRVSDPVAAQRELLEQRFGVAADSSNIRAVDGADVVVLAVKPQDLASVARELAPAIASTGALVISIAAGIRASDIARWLGGASVVRAMPNRPALLGCGATALYAPAAVAQEQRELATQILSAVGIVVWVDDESHMDAVTAVSGSGPAYFFLLIELLEAAGTGLGLAQPTARQLAVETAFGAASMARATGEDPALLREQVTSKGGTTAAALAVLEADGVRDIFRRAVQAAAERSSELADHLGAQ